MLLGKPKCLYSPLRFTGGPLDIEVTHEEGYQLSHLHNRYVLPDTCPGAIAKL